MSEIALSRTLSGVLTSLRAGVPTDDPELARRLDAAFSKHERSIASLCRRHLRGLPDAHVEEVVQDVLLEAWRKMQLPEFDAAGSFRSWLWKIAEFKCANLRRKRREELSDDGLFEAGAVESQVLTELARAERDELLDTAIQNVLDAHDQEIVHLRYVVDLPHEEIAEVLELERLDLVRVALVRCRRRLEREVSRLLRERGLRSSFLRPG